MTPEAAILSRSHTPATSHDAIPVAQDMRVVMDGKRVRLLIEDWLPITEVGIESLRERTPMTPFPAPNRLHVWWARRPLVASRAAVLCSLIPSSDDEHRLDRLKALVKHMLGIHGDPVKAKRQVAEARRTGGRVDNPYTWSRAFNYLPTVEETAWLARASGLANLTKVRVLDPTAGGGSIPFEASRLGADTIANDLNPVAWMVLKATVEFPRRHGPKLAERYWELSKLWRERMQARVAFLFPADPAPNQEDATYLWARTIKCPYCGGAVPLSPHWKLDAEGKGVKLVFHVSDPENRYCTFEVVDKAKDHSPETVKGGNARCPYPDCGRFIDGEEVKSQAGKGQMGQQMYAVVYRRRFVTGQTKTKPPRPKIKVVRGFRAPRGSDEVEAQVRAALDAKMPDLLARDIIPTEEIPPGYETTIRWPLDRYGFRRWTDFFTPRQLYGHCSSVEVFQELIGEVRGANGGDVPELERAALSYLAIAIDKMLDYNSKALSWHATRGVLEHTFRMHSFSFKWSFAEMAPTIRGLGYDWVVEETGKALEELCTLVDGAEGELFKPSNNGEKPEVQVTLGSADAMCLGDQSVDCIVMDPPYYNNVTYSELSDFFYVWLKRTIGLLYPEQFADHLVDKDREAVANPFRFRGQKNAKELACRDYEERMAAIFKDCRRVLNPKGVMTVMFTHKSSNAWDALASGIVRAGFVITGSWPVNTEAEGSLHIKERSAAKSTIILVCRPRDAAPADAGPVYWEDVAPKVVEKVRQRIGEFQAAGIVGVDLYMACFGPALQVFSESWPLRRGRALQHTNGRNGRGGRKGSAQPDDPYAVRPEDAFEAARREVKNWRLGQLATVKRQHHLDPLTEWYVLAWDTFKAPRFSADEGLRLARVVGLDFDRQVKNVVCQVKGEDVLLWDSKARAAKGRLGAVDGTVMLDVLHHAALIGREQNTGAAKAVIEEAKLLDDPTLLTTLEVLLNVLPPPAAARQAKKADALLGGAASDFEALEKLRRLAFTEQVPEPKQRELFPVEVSEHDGEDDEDAG